MMVERIMYVDSKTPVNCVFTAKINGKIPEENIKTALQKIQQKHPLLRVSIDHTSVKYPFFIEEKDISPIPIRIVKRKTNQDWLQESENEWYRIFENKKKPLAQLVWIRGENVSEILWVMPHCICDGTTGVTLMKELLALLDDPSIELEPYQTFNSVEDFLPADFNFKKKKRKAGFYLIMAKLFFLMQRKSKTRNLGKNYAIHRKLDAETTKKIIEKCKANGVSVHALLCSAFMQAFKDAKGKMPKEK
ncbi:condensation domain-containing protein [Chryseobacterium wanjuense]